MKLTEVAKTVLQKRYLKGNETPEDMLKRVAKVVASVEKKPDYWEEIFFNMMNDLDFLPNTPTLINAGKENGQLSACFVLPIEDSMDSIFTTLKNMAMIHKTGGGTGFSFSSLRPKNDIVGSTKGVASGPISFMEVFDKATDVVKQGGVRRGANMGVLRVDHPDIEEFITFKRDNSKLTNFNISVGVTDEFMECVVENSDFDLINPRNGKVVKTVKANRLFDLIVESAWESAEPGILFLDEINRRNPYGVIEATNPCGEQILLPYESCNLGSINLSNMVSDDGRFLDGKFRETIWRAVRFLDNVIDINTFPTEEIKEATLKTRKIGLGVMGFHDMLIKLGIKYNSKQAYLTAENIARMLNIESHESSRKIGKQKGCIEVVDVGRRNLTTTTIAPTGSLSLIAGVSSGIEPIFSLTYTRKVVDGTEVTVVHPLLLETLSKEEVVFDSNTLEEDLPKQLKDLFVTAHEIEPIYHLNIQAAFQQFVDNAVSKTINLSHDATKKDVEEIFMSAWEMGCKGITIYRDKSRVEQVMNNNYETNTSPTPKELNKSKFFTSSDKNFDKDTHVDHLKKKEPRNRPDVTTGFTKRVKLGCGNLYVTVNKDSYGICEVFAQLGKAGGCADSQTEAVCRLISLCMRSGIDIKSVVKHLKGIRCPNQQWNNGKLILSCADAIGNVLEEVIDDKQSEVENKPNNISITNPCPECGYSMNPDGGCFVCPSCGYTKCE